MRTLNRNYVHGSVLQDAESVLCQLPVWLAYYNNLHPHCALVCRSPRDFIVRTTQDTLFGLRRDNNTRGADVENLASSASLRAGGGSRTASGRIDARSYTICTIAKDWICSQIPCCFRLKVF